MNYSKEDANTENRKEEWTHLSGAILKAFDLYLSQGPYLSLFSPFSFIGRSLKTQANYSTHLVVVFDSLKIWRYHNIRWSIVFLSCYSNTWTDSMCMEILRVFSRSNEISYFIFVLWAQPWPSPSRCLSYFHVKALIVMNFTSFARNFVIPYRACCRALYHRWFACHWIRIASLVFWLFLKRTQLNSNNSGGVYNRYS